MLKILVSSANIYTSDSMLDGKSFMYSTNKIGPSTLPCGMPLVTGFQVELAPFMHVPAVPVLIKRPLSNGVFRY